MSSAGTIITAAKRVVQSRPLLTLSTASVTSITSYAYYVEYQTTVEASKYISINEKKGNVNANANNDAINAKSNGGLDVGNGGGNGSVDVNKYVLPRDYSRNALSTYWSHRPISVAMRLVDIVWEIVPFALSCTKDFYVLQKHKEKKGDTNGYDKKDLQTAYAKELRHKLTKLGPAFVKLGQQLSIRPDLLPSSVLFELQRLCDQVEPISDEEAKFVLKSELGDSIHILEAEDNIHHDDNNHDNDHDDVIRIKDLKLVASASLGQVYKATRIQRKKRKNNDIGWRNESFIMEEEEIAIKVQRPEMKQKVSLDLYLLNNCGSIFDFIFGKLTNQMTFYEDSINCFAHGSYNELDYIKESQNQGYLKTELNKRGITPDKVYIPDVFHDMTSEKVITMDWVDGIKLANADSDDVQKLIPVGVELFLTQLLDIGFFHSDPHPGNLYVIQKKSTTGMNETKSSSNTATTSTPILCLLDFGLCAEIDSQSRLAMTKAIVHLLSGDYNTLINKDAKELGFLPHDLDISSTDIQPVLTKILKEGLLESKSNLVERKRNLMAISNELNEVFFEYPFSVPPFFALITRGLGLLEGIALSGDPNFDIFQASYPYASRRAAEIYGKHSWSWVKRWLSRKGNDEDKSDANITMIQTLEK